MSGEVRSRLGILGGAIAMFSVVGGLCGLAESIHHWHLENVQACLGLAFGGGIVGLTMLILGKTGEKQDSPSDNLNRCKHCGSQLTGDTKVCTGCMTNVK